MSSAPKAAAGPMSASAARRGGDEYQDVVAWCAALELVRPRPRYGVLELEAVGAGSVDDVVLRTLDPSSDEGDRFIQVKWTGHESRAVDERFLTSRGRGNTRSLLQKLHDSYRLLAAQQNPANFTMELHTNRGVDSQHPLLAGLDGRSGLLVPTASIATSDSPIGRARESWARHLDVEEHELVDMLRVLEWNVGRQRRGERDRAKALMSAAGLRDDDTALDAGLGVVAGWVRGGRRIVRPQDVRDAIELAHLRTIDVATIVDGSADPRAHTARVTPIAVQSRTALYRELRLDHFTGRDWLREEVDRRLGAVDAPGYVLIEGPAGTGKTAFMAALAEERGWIVHFAGLQGGDQLNSAIENFAAQLIQRYELGDQPLPGGGLPEAATQSAWLMRVIEAAALKHAETSGGEPLVLLLDALDEMAARQGPPLGLPQAMPPNVFLLSTSRSSIELLPYDPQIIRLQIDGARNLSDMSSYITRICEVPEIAAHLKSAGRDIEWLTRTMLEVCGGLWIYARYVIRELQLGTRSITDLARLPRRLESYYCEVLDLDHRDPASWDLATRRVLSTLGGLKAPVSATLLADLADLGEADRKHMVDRLNRARPLLLRMEAAGQGGEVLYDVYHRSLTDFLCGDFITGPDDATDLVRRQFAADRAPTQERITRSLLAYVESLDNQGPAAGTSHIRGSEKLNYALQALPSHLDEVGMMKELVSLYGPAARWYDLNYDEGRPDLFHAGLMASREAVARSTDRAVEADGVGAGIGNEFKLALASSAMAAHSRGTPSRLLARAGELLPLQFPQALLQARQLKATDRAVTLALLAPHHHDPRSLWREAFEALDSVEYKEPPARILESLVPSVPDEHLDLALDLIEGWLPVDSCGRPLQALSARLGSELIPRAIGVTRRIDYDPTRLLTLAALYPRLASASDREALRNELVEDLIRGGTHVPPKETATLLARNCTPDEVADSLAALAGKPVTRHLLEVAAAFTEYAGSDSPEPLVALMVRYVEAATSHKKRLQRASRVLAGLPDDTIGDLLEAALRYPGKQGKRLATAVQILASRLRAEQRRQVWGVLAATKSVDQVYLRRMLETLMAFVADEDAQEAAEVAGRLEQATTRCFTLIELGVAVGRAQGVRIANTALRQLENLGQYDTVSCVISVLEGFGYDAELFREAVKGLSKSRHFAGVMEKWLPAGLYLRLLAIASTANERHELSEAALGLLERLPEEWTRERDEALGGLSSFLDATQVRRALTMCGDTAWRREVALAKEEVSSLVQHVKIADNPTFVSGLGSVADQYRHLSSSELLRQALRSTTAEPARAAYYEQLLQRASVKGGLCERVLTDMVGVSPADDLHFLARLAQGLRGGHDQAAVFTALARRDPEAYARAAATLLPSVYNKRERVTLLTTLLASATGDLQVEIREMRDLCLEELADDNPSDFASAVASVGSDASWLIPRALAAMSRIGMLEWRIVAYAAVFSLLNHEQRRLVWSDVFESTANFGDPFRKVDFLVRVTPLPMAEGLFAQAAEQGNFPVYSSFLRQARFPPEVLEEAVRGLRLLVTDDHYGCLWADIMDRLSSWDEGLVPVRGIQDQHVRLPVFRRLVSCAPDELVLNLTEELIETVQALQQTHGDSTIIFAPGVHDWIVPVLERGQIGSWPMVRSAALDRDLGQLLRVTPSLVAMAERAGNNDDLEAIVEAISWLSDSTAWRAQW